MNSNRISSNTHSFNELRSSKIKTVIDVSNNPIKDFTGLSQHIKVHTVRANNSLIESFKGSENMPSLEVLMLNNTPVSKSSHFITMALIAFGHKLQVINGIFIGEKQRKTANDISSRVRKLIFEGYIIVSIEPLLVKLPNSREIINVDMDESEFMTKEKQILDNQKKIEELQEMLEGIKRKKRAEQNSHLSSIPLSQLVLKSRATHSTVIEEKPQSPIKMIPNDTIVELDSNVSFDIEEEEEIVEKNPEEEPRTPNNQDLSNDSYPVSPNPAEPKSVQPQPIFFQLSDDDLGDYNANLDNGDLEEDMGSFNELFLEEEQGYEDFENQITIEAPKKIVFKRSTISDIKLPQ